MERDVNIETDAKEETGAAPDEEINTGDVEEHHGINTATNNNDAQSDAKSTETSNSNSTDESVEVHNTHCVCTVAQCNKAADSRMVACNNCERYTHFSCTQLPPYQISMFMTKGYRRYVCEDCYVRQNGEVHSDYHEPHDTGTSPAKETQTVSAWKAWDDLNQLYKKCESEREQMASEKDATEREMKRAIEDLGKQLALTRNELNRVNDSQTVQKNENQMINERLQAEKRECESQRKKVSTLEEEAKNLEQRLRTQGHILSNERKKRASNAEENQGTEVLSLKTQLENMQLLLDKKTKEALTLAEENKKLRMQQDGKKKTCSPENDGVQKLENIEALLNKRLDKIENSIDSIISKKLGESIKEVTQIGAKIDDAITNNKKSFAEISGGDVTNSLTTAFRNSKNEAMVQEKEREKRSANLIIYGINESSDGEIKEHDQNFIAALLDKIGVAQRPKQLFRLGAQAEGKTRPVKLVMATEADKDTIMARLGNLKNAEDVYRKVSVRDDYTLEERELVREYVKKAEAKNAAENTQEWKVRGTPKTGLKVVRITKRQQ